MHLNCIGDDSPHRYSNILPYKFNPTLWRETLWSPPDDISHPSSLSVHLLISFLTHRWCLWKRFGAARLFSNPLHLYSSSVWFTFSTHTIWSTLPRDNTCHVMHSFFNRFNFMPTIFPPILSDLFEHSPRHLNFFSTFRLLPCLYTPAAIQNILENQNILSLFPNLLENHSTSRATNYRNSLDERQWNWRELGQWVRVSHNSLLESMRSAILKTILLMTFSRFNGFHTHPFLCVLASSEIIPERIWGTRRTTRDTAPCKTLVSNDGYIPEYFRRDSPVPQWQFV